MCSSSAWDFFILSFFIDIFPNFASINHRLYKAKQKKSRNREDNKLNNR